MKAQNIRLVLAAIAMLVGLIGMVELARASDVIVYDASMMPSAPLTGRGVRVLENGQKVGGWKAKLFLTDQARNASENLIITRDFFQNWFNRDSYDNRGSAIIALVRVGVIPHDIFGMRQNAAWVSPFQVFSFGFGQSEGLHWFTSALDVIAHEFTHAVIESTSKLKYEGQSGALNEHLADFFGEAVQILAGRARPADYYLIGEGVLSDELKKGVRDNQHREVEGLRDMREPSKSLSPQPETVAQIPAAYGPGCVSNGQNDNCGVHALSGIPNRASVLMVDQMGLETVVRLVYGTMVTHLKPTSNFSDYRAGLKFECQLQGRPNCGAIDWAFDQVGIY